jgi:sugar transferase (PEP-CTERM/EpsH1 system associated)
MRMVVTSARFPYPLDKGDRLTVFHLLKYFSQRHEVSLVCFLEPEQDPDWVEKVAPFCERVELVPLRRLRAYSKCLTGALGRTPLQMHYYADPVMHDTVRRVVQEVEPDLLYAQLIRMGQYIAPYESPARVAAFNLSMTLNHRRLSEHASGVSKLFHWLEYQKLRSFEAEYARHFERILLISKYDLQAIEQKEPLENVFFSPHGVDYEYFAPDTTVQKVPSSLVLTGNLNYTPNVDGALYFCREILPLVRAQDSQAKLAIVGADPTPEVQALGRDPAVEVTGRVPDLRPYMNRAQVGVAPIRIGAGLQNKVLEGMSMALPMVATSVANEGIQAIDSENILLADSATAFADHILRLLNEPERRKQLGQAARQFIATQWTWEKHFDDLEEMFVDLVDEKRREHAERP